MDPYQVVLPPSSVPPPRPDGRPVKPAEEPFTWRDWCTCGGCLSIVVALVLAVVFYGPILRFLAHLFIRQ